MSVDLDSIGSDTEMYPDYNFTNEDPQQGGKIREAVELQKQASLEIIENGGVPTIFFVGSMIYRGAEYVSAVNEVFGKDIASMFCFIQMDITSSDFNR
ncbi:MAG: hypothetical protein Q9M91_07575 [Candidatus Dojkabacteria bacterium]|nr:hypothetical protein [Candidatus Dojkabacteria bacterium]MDQ7021645.1 hypothetical protein [Candidatus Dojkabacteria bacterium]